MTQESGRASVGATRIYTAGGWVSDHVIDFTAEGRIAALRAASAEERLGKTAGTTFHTGASLIPGLVDIQVNGGGGSMFALQRDAQAYAEVAAAHGRTGTTAICPTIVTGPPADMLEAVALAADLCDAEPVDRARAVGVHIEGPFVDEQMRGGHAPQYILPPDLGLLKELIAAGRGNVRIYSLAPELPGALPLVDWLSSQGITVSAGHTAATDTQLRASMAHGLTGVTHIFNGMGPLVNRSPGVVGVALSSHLLTGLIGDLLHVSADTVGVVLRAKSSSELYLTTDAVSPLGSESGSFDLYGTRVTVRDGGCYTDEGILAGTATPLFRMMLNMLDLGASLEDALRMATVTPASVINRPEVGALAVGAWGDALVLDNMEITDVYVGGRPL